MGVKVLSAVLMMLLVLSGPLASAAWAQEKSEGQMAPAKGDDSAWEFAANVTNVIAVPGRAFLCGFAALTGTAALLITFGSQYETAGRIWNEGCSGKWTVTAADVKPKVEESEFIVDRPDYRKEDFQRTQ
jgi:hypothetical protein